jgi:hypothetical protein
LEQWWLALMLVATVGFASSFLDWTRIYGIEREGFSAGRNKNLTRGKRLALGARDLQNPSIRESKSYNADLCLLVLDKG